jgi:hypothetical protein
MFRRGLATRSIRAFAPTSRIQRESDLQKTLIVKRLLKARCFSKGSVILIQVDAEKNSDDSSNILTCLEIASSLPV